MKKLLERFPIRSPDTAFRTVDSNAVIIELSNSLINVLNPVGSRIWEIADGSRRLGEIIDGILSEFDVKQEQAEKDVIEFVQGLASKQLILLYDTSAPINRDVSTGEGEMKIVRSSAIDCALGDKSPNLERNPYEKPMIIYRSKMETRAGFCSEGTGTNKQSDTMGCTAIWS